MFYIKVDTWYHFKKPGDNNKQIEQLNQEWVIMFKVNIEGSFRGSFGTSAEAMAYVDKFARPFRKSWEIIDNFGKVFAKG